MKKIVIIIISIIFLSIFNISLASENTYLDSLELVYADSKTSDQEKIRCSIIISNEYRKINVDSAFILINKTFDLINDQDLNLESIQKFLGEAYIKKGNIYHTRGEYIKAIDEYKLAFATLDKFNNDSLTVGIHSNMALLYANLRDLSNAEKYFNKIENIFKSLNYPLKKMQFLVNYSNFARHQKKYSKAKQLGIECLNLSNTHGYSEGKFHANMGLAFVHTDEGESDSITYYLNEAEKVAVESANDTFLGSVYLNRSFFENAKGNESDSLGNKSQAILHFKESISSLKKATSYYTNKDRRALLVIYSNLTHAYKNIKDFEKALEFKTKFHKLQDSFELNKTQLKIKKIEATKYNELKDQEIGLLSKANEEHQLVIILSISVLLLMLIGMTNLLISRKRREAKNKELALLNSTKDKFFSIIAHDLRNPISNFKDSLKMLCDDHDMFTPEETREFMLDLKKSSESVAELLDNLLEWSRSQRGQIELLLENQNLQYLLQSNVELQSLSAGKKNIKLKSNLSSELNALYDYNTVSTVVRNLVSNAIKFTPEGGTITLDAVAKNGSIEVSVTDDGQGMDEKSLANLFKIDVSHTTDGTAGEKGTGLGLILCKEFIEKNNGEIGVTSQLGVGTCFYFNLPNS